VAGVSEYLFGDTDLAAQRLKLLASVYQESTRSFLVRAAASGHFRVALDLGCGPGFTTRLIADTLACDRVTGLDASPAFIKLAIANSGEGVSFLQHDITSIPFATGRANLIFSRFLLTHLSDAAGVVAKWVTELEPRGLLLLEEAEVIHTSDPIFARYLRIVEEMLASHSNQLYAGQLVASLNFESKLTSVTNESTSLSVRNADAARMFALNLQTWKENQFVRANYSHDSIVELENALAEIASNESAASDIEWKLRQAAWTKE
jgi:trans-aconitate 2-methyltransferase